MVLRLLLLVAGLGLPVLGWAILAWNGGPFRALPAPSLPTLRPEVWWAAAPLGALIVAALALSLRNRGLRPARRPRYLGAAILVVGGLAVARLLLERPPLSGVPWLVPETTLPVVLAALPLGLLVSRPWSLALLALLAFATGYVHIEAGLWRWDLAMLVLGAGLPAVLVGGTVRSRSGIIATGLLAGAGGVCAWAARISILESGWMPGEALPGVADLQPAIGALASAAASAVLVAAFLPLFERLLGVTSNVTLAECLRLDHPVLLMLKETAPGTYHHSLNVGALAAAGARAVRANPLLAQAGGHFHDLGKVTRPSHFVENIQGPNPHDRLPPEESADIILAHTRDGYEIARKHRLPPEVATITREHQGTTVIEFFYHKARKSDPGVPEEKFRYPGPAPRGKESALVMVADSVEARCRTLDPDAGAFGDAVDFILERKEEQGQLRRSGIRRSDFPRIREAFVKTLEGIFHRRIKYPGDPVRRPPDASPDVTGRPGTPGPDSPGSPPGGTGR